MKIAKVTITFCLFAVVLLGPRLSAAALGLSSSSPEQIADPGVLATDALKGNGTGAGYILAHANVVPNSDSVTVDGCPQIRNKDYYLDFETGALFFTQPVENTQTIKVVYRYLPRKNNNQVLSLLPPESFSIGKNASIALTYACDPATRKRNYDLTVSGFNLATKLGSNCSMTNLLYVSSATSPARLSLGLVSEPEATTTVKPPSDSIFLHSSEFQTGKLALKLNYQDVGADFVGFPILKTRNSVPAELLAQLQKEQGLKRVGFQAKYDLGGNASTDISWKRISESGNDVVNQSLSLTSNEVKLNASSIAVDEGFTRAADLPETKCGQGVLQAGMKRREVSLALTPKPGVSANVGLLSVSDAAGDIIKRSIDFANPYLKLNLTSQSVDKEFTHTQGLENLQWAAERGIRRSNIELSLAPLKGAGKDWNALSITRIRDESGGLTSSSLNFGVRGFSVTLDESKVDAGFSRLRDLAPSDHTAMALKVYRQFDPKATADSISPYDQQAMINQAGVERRNLRVDAQLGTTTAALQLLTVGDESGSLERRTLSIQGKSYKLTGLFQDVDEGFTRVFSLSPIEQANFGNEHGMHRTNLAADLALGPGLALSSSFARVAENDASLTKWNISLNSPKWRLVANLRDIDPDFHRINDLADADKLNLIRERGTRAYDLRLVCQPSKSVKIDSFFYNATGVDDVSSGRQFTNAVTINPARGAKISLFHDTLAWMDGDSASASTHAKYTLSHKVGTVSLNMLYDSVDTHGETGNKDVETRSIGLATDPNKKTSLSADWEAVSRTNGKSTNSVSLTLKHQLTKALSFSGTTSVLNTTAGEKKTQEYGLTGSAFGNISLSYKFGEATLDGAPLNKTREFSLKPASRSNFGILKNVDWSVGFSDVLRCGMPTTRKGLAKLEADFLGAKLVFQQTDGLTGRGVPGIPPGQKTTDRLFSLVGGGEDSRFTYDLSYKTSDPGDGSSKLIRRYKADWRVGDSTKLSYTYASYPEGRNRRLLDPRGVGELTATQVLNDKLNLVAQLKRDHDYVKSKFERELALGLTGKVSSLGNLQVLYGYDRITTPDGVSSAHTYKLKYDYRVSADQFIVFGGRYTNWSGPKPASADDEDLLIQLDFKTIWK